MLKKYILLSLIFFLFGLTIYGGQDYFDSRFLKEIWNLGHILLFALLTLAVFNYWPRFIELRTKKQILVLVLITFVLSIMLEGSQYIFANGTPDLRDIWRNFLGLFLILIFVKNSKKAVIYPIRILLIIFICLEFIAPVSAFMDEYRGQKIFPILADFESDWQLNSWSGKAQYEASADQFISGKKALKIIFLTDKYSGISLNEFPRNWLGYSTLSFQMYNPDTSDLTITCRIHDKHHFVNQIYSDRFNREYHIKTGWNKISISLDDVQNAPKNRKMDLSKIGGFGIFTIGLDKPRSAFLDDIRLTN